MVEMKNCFDNGAFKICDEDEVSEGTKVMRCVFSYKVKTGSDDCDACQSQTRAQALPV